MLNKEICLRCWQDVYRNNGWEWLVDIYTKEGWEQWTEDKGSVITCPYGPKISGNSSAPENCPYIAEHTVSVSC